MSSGTNIELLEKIPIQLKGKLKKLVEEKVKLLSVDGFTGKEIKAPEWVSVRKDFINYVVNMNTKKVYRYLISEDFNSLFHPVRDYFDLNPYNNQDSVVLPMLTINNMIEAIEYVLNENYDRKVERLLNNPFIEIFGYLYSPYLKYDDDGNKVEIKETDHLTENEMDERAGLMRFLIPLKLAAISSQELVVRLIAW